MRRLAVSFHWRLAIQLALLGGIGLAFMAQPGPEAAAGEEPGCFAESMCTFKKPNFLIVLDYSSSMNDPFGPDGTRWEVAVDSIITLMSTDNGYFQENMHVALMRYGSDYYPSTPGSAHPSDHSGLVDGQRLDVPWYASADDPTYFECNGPDSIDSLIDTPPPPPLCDDDDDCIGMGTWTKGALDYAREIIAESKLAHPEDVVPGSERFYGLMVVTDGEWTDQIGAPPLSPPEQNPALTAAELFDEEGIPTYVVAVADAAHLPFAHELAEAGGTHQSISAQTPQGLFEAMGQVVQDIGDQVIVPECTAGLPRVMILLDASSSMLNDDGAPGSPGETGWDQARAALAAGDNSLFDVEVPSIGLPVADLVHLGLAVFGGDDPAEEKLLFQYGPCMQDNLAWALDPATSCAQPGCDDPWGGPPIDWTFVDGSTVEPYFDQQTISHMPACQPSDSGTCRGSGTYTHRGLEFVFDNLMNYKSAPELYPIDDATQYVNVLITDGNYSGYSTDTQVQGALESMFAVGVTTYVIGFGDGVGSTEAQQQLGNMAAWGSGGQSNFFDASTQAELEAALAAVIEGIEFDPCCAFNDCSENAEPTTGEPDPGMDTDSSGSGGSGGPSSAGHSPDDDMTGDGFDHYGCDCNVDSENRQGRWAPLALLGLCFLGLSTLLRRRD